MSSRSRGFWARIFAAGKQGGTAGAPSSLFPPRAPVARELPRAALPPAPPPGIVIAAPPPDPKPEPLPADVPPPAPPPVAAPAPGSRLAAPPAEPAPAAAPPLPSAPALPAPALPAPALPALALAAPAAGAAALAARPTVLASVLAELPAPLPLPAVAAPDPAAPERFAELADLRANSVAVGQPGFWGGQLLRLALAPAAALPEPTPLLLATERFTNEFVINWHREPRPAPPADVACYFATDVVVSGPGHVWLDGRLVTSTELMPAYVYSLHNIAEQGARLLGAHGLRLREIDGPCVVLIGHGLQVYGHFVIELLFRVLAVRRALRGTGLAVRWLLDASAPAWLLRIVNEDLGIQAEDIEFFRADDERVRLRQAILPGLVHGLEGFHPFAGDLVEDLVASLAPLPEMPPTPRVFVARRGFRNPHPSHSASRETVNEQALIALATARGFVPVAAEELPWRRQLALFRNAEVLVGPFGSALHTALVAPAGTRVGVLGLMNTTQSEIGSLRGHRMGYLTNGFEVRGQSSVPEDAFDAFLAALCGPAAAQGAGRPSPQAEPPAPVAPVMTVPGAVAIERPAFGQARIGRLVVAAAAPPRAPQPLLAGTEAFALPGQRAAHRDARPLPAREAACIFAEDAIVGAGGVVWLDGAPVTAPELIGKPFALPPEGDAAAEDLPLRDVEGLCVTIPGPGADSYASFITDILPRILLARRAVYDAGERIRLLLDAAAPNWLLRLLRVDLRFGDKELERFTPQTERVRLRQALLPGVVYGEDGFHPLVDDLVSEVVDRLLLPDVPVALRLYLQRPTPAGVSADAPRGDCRNEAALAKLAEALGFVPITLDTLPWRERIARLRMARVLLAAPGVGMQSLLFASEGTRVAAIGMRGTPLTEIGALRGHRVAYFSDGVPAKGPFTLPEEHFPAFLAALCDPNAEAARAA